MLNLLTAFSILFSVLCFFTIARSSANDVKSDGYDLDHVMHLVLGWPAGSEVIRSKRSVQKSKGSGAGRDNDLDSDYANENITALSPDSARLSNPVECVNSAFDDFKARVLRVVPEMSNVSVSLRLKPAAAGGRFKSTHLFESYEVKSFVKFCNVYSTLPPRLEQCPKSSTLTLVKNVLRIMDFFCKDRYEDFKKYLPCFQKSAESMARLCDPKCDTNPSSAATKSPGSKAKIRASKNESISGDDMQQWKDMLQKDCQQIQCEIGCKGPIMKDQCGADALDLVKQALRAIFKTLIDVTKLGRMEEVWPKQCVDLARYA